MDWATIITVIISGFFSSSVLTAIVNCVIKRNEKKDKKNEKLDEVLVELKSLSKKVDTLDTKVSNLEERLTNVEAGLEITKSGTQRLLRAELRRVYKEWVKKGYCPTDVKEDFEDMYTIYHNLGKNGVMDKNRDKLMALPEEPKKRLLKEEN